ncbi:MAG TPA: lysylphosphatidylglycerol synthase transmembrane domain-containing protein [Thermomicrobiales bacterium]|nr:lysylphosphatidylglycerol synthase transmembrane domain-containing protein [Thermomicrobiales bacterium]
MSAERAVRDSVPASMGPDADAASISRNGDGPDRPISIGERLRSPQTIISFLVAFALIFFIFRQLDINFGDVWLQIRHAQPAYLFLAFAIYYGAFLLRSTRWRLLLANAGISKGAGFNVPGTWGLSEIYVLSWFANCVVPAKLGDAYRGYLLKKNAGPSFSRTLGTILAERLLDIIALVTLMVVSGLFVFHGSVPPSLRWWFGAGAALVAIGLCGFFALLTMSHRIQYAIPARFRPYYHRLSEGIVTSFARKGFLTVASLTALIWAMEGARVYFIARALGVELSLPASIFIALLASLLTTFPLTPAGFGVVEGGTVLALKLFGISASGATAVALIDRGIASYSVVLIGGALYFVSKRK